jgi:hypothetical protein
VTGDHVSFNARCRRYNCAKAVKAPDMEQRTQVSIMITSFDIGRGSDMGGTFDRRQWRRRQGQSSAETAASFKAGELQKVRRRSGAGDSHHKVR